MSHPNIVQLYEVYENKSRIYLVTELCAGRELFDEMLTRKVFREAEAANVIKQVLMAVAYCHKKDVAHRDLKPENIIIDPKGKDAVKVIDFGLSQPYARDDHTMTLCGGSPHYIAPEVVGGHYDEKCDLWSIGVILYTMLSGLAPFEGDNPDAIVAKVRKGVFDFPAKYFADKSPEVKDLICKMLTLDASKRISARDAI